MANGIAARAWRSFVSVAGVERRPCRVIARAMLVLLAMVSAPCVLGCGDQGFFPTTVDPGADFAVADVVFEENYFYCKVEPVLFSNRCGGGDSSSGDPAGGCHFSATPYRLTDYLPHVSDVGGGCGGGLVPATVNFPDAARHNYETSQARMKRDPTLAPLLQRPTQGQFHPRKIFEPTSPDADAIRQWATRFSNQ